MRAQVVLPRRERLVANGEATTSARMVQILSQAGMSSEGCAGEGESCHTWAPKHGSSPQNRTLVHSARNGTEEPYNLKLFAVVATDGTVRAIEPVGGSPLLIQASEDAIKRWICSCCDRIRRTDRTPFPSRVMKSLSSVMKSPSLLGYLLWPVRYFLSPCSQLLCFATHGVPLKVE